MLHACGEWRFLRDVCVLKKLVGVAVYLVDQLFGIPGERKIAVFFHARDGAFCGEKSK